MMGKYVSKIVALLLLTLVGMIPTWAAYGAQTESNGLASLGLPELNVTITSSAVEGIPDQVEAGRYLVSVAVDEDVEFGSGIGFIQPVGGSIDELLAALTGPPPGDQGGTPDASPAASEDHGDHAGGLPAIMFDSIYAGGVGVMSGGTGHVVLDLTPGEWIAWGEDPSLPQAPVTFQVTGEMPSDLAEPSSSATLVMGEYLIEVADGVLTSGHQVVRIDNAGAQPHFIGWFLGPDGMTEDQIAVALDEEAQAETTGTTPEYSGLNPEEDLMPITFTGTQSNGTSIWIEVDLQAGTHGLACFFPDVSDGVPHAYHGMYSVIEVAE